MKKIGILLSTLLLISTSLLIACGHDNGTLTPSMTSPTMTTTSPPTTNGQTVEITVGVITDLTGPGSIPLKPINNAIEDTARYINEINPIPGVELNVLKYDSEYDPSRDKTGFEWLVERGAKVIITPQPHTAEMLKNLAEKNGVPILTYAANKAMVDPPGWVFCTDMLTRPMVGTMLQFISNQWNNYPTKPKIGTCGVSEPAQETFAEAVESYCRMHPDKFEFVSSMFGSWETLDWSNEAEKLKDCDYVGFNQAMGMNAIFINDLREAGSDAKIFGLSANPASKGFFVDACGWEALDGSLNLLPWGWWGDPFEGPQLAAELLDRYHSDKEAEKLIENGSSYLSVYAPLIFFDIIRTAVEQVGAENFTGDSFYTVAMQFSKQYEGYPERSFSESYRHFPEEAAVYEWDSEVEDLIRISDWLPGVEW